MERICIRSLFAACLAAVVALIASCTFTTPDTTPLTLQAPEALTDTMDLWPSLTFTFSTAVADSFAAMKLDPDMQGSYASMLHSADSMDFTVTDPQGLAGSTAYVLALAGDLHAANGSVLSASAARYSFVTRPAENEPNNRLSDADTLNGTLCGALYPVSDTDYYRCPRLKGLTLSLLNIRGTVNVVLVDSLGLLSPAPIIGSTAEAYVFSKTAAPGCIAVINGGIGLARYRLTLGKQP